MTFSLKRLCYLWAFLSSFSLHALTVKELASVGNYAPGEEVRIKVVVTNELNKPDEATLTLCDYACNCKGEHFYEPNGTASRSNRAWITQHSTKEMLAPGESADVYFTVKIPKDPSLQGCYWSVVLIESGSPAQVIQNPGLTIDVKIRYAYHIITNVGKGIPKVKLLSKEVLSIGGQKCLAIDVVNEGSLFLHPKATLKVFNKAGKIEKTSEAAEERLYPSNSKRYLLSVDGLAPGKYKAYLLLDNGDNQLFGDSFEFTVP